jgi:hypothetical protein
MPAYLLVARNPHGRKVAECVEAPTADLAVTKLREGGYTEIVLHTDDVVAATFRAMEKGMGPKMSVDEFISPREQVRSLYVHGYLGQVLSNLRSAFAKGSWSDLLGLAWMCFLLVSFGWFVWMLEAPQKIVIPFGLIALLVVLSPLLLAVIAPLLSGGKTYDRLVEHACWGRWEEVLRALPSLPRLVPAFERALRKGQALAGLGKLKEGLACFRPFADNGEIPQWMYWSLLALIYRADRNWDEALAAHERAAELAPDKPAVLIDLAGALLRYKNDARRAKELLDIAMTHAVPRTALPYVASVRGLLALSEGDAKAAVDQFQETLKKADSCLQENAMTRFFIDQTHADLTVAYGRLFQTELGLRHFHLAAPRLRERGWDLLPLNVGS